MEDLWTRIAELEGRELTTVNGKSFTVDKVSDDTVVITMSTGRKNRIRRWTGSGVDKFEAAYRLKRPAETLRPADIAALKIRGFSFNRPYVAGMINALD